MSKLKFFKNKYVTKYDYIVSQEQPNSYIAESYQKAIVNLEYINIDSKYKVVAFTSTLAGAGKTTTISNFAYLLAKSKKKVCVIDLDLRKPKINRIFNAINENGVTDYLAGKINLSTLIKHDESGVDYILSGEKTDAVINVLSADKLKDLIKTLRETYDYVLVDAPPVLAVSDPLYIAKIVDGFIFVVAYNEAKRKLVNDAVLNIKRTNSPILGIMFTQVDSKESGYGYGYNYGYGNGYNDDLDKRQ